ncbi:Uma2 family endonuclease [Aquifex sp.]
MAKTLKKGLSGEEKRKLLKILTYEKVNGKPVYYRDYRKVLKGELPPEAVMGSSGLQALIIRLIVEFLLKTLDLSRYEILFNEVGFLHKKSSWRNLDIAIFEKEKLEPYLMQDKLISVPPKVVIEVDTKADLSKYKSFEAYMYEKTQELLNAGVEKVIWIVTKPKKILIAEQGRKWIIQDIDEDIEVLANIKFKIPQLFKERGYRLW